MKKILLIPVSVLILALVHQHSNAQTYLWAKSAGGTANDRGRSVAIDAAGNILVTGYFISSSITFGTATLVNANPGFSDMFIVKYDAGGNVLWAKSAGGTAYDYGYSVGTDTAGNILVTGSFQSSSITFGTATLNNAGGGSADMFVVKYDTGGNVIWARKQDGGGTSSDYAYSVDCDNNGNIIVAGYFYSSSITFGTTTLTNSGNNDMFILKYDAGGNVLWAKSAGGTADDGSNGVVTDGAGNIFVTGYFYSSSITFGTTTLTNLNTFSTDMYIVKYDAGGIVLWAKQQGAGGASYDYGYDVVSDAGGNVLVTGSFQGPSITFGTATLTNTGTGPDMFLVKFDAGGNVLWARMQDAGGAADDVSYSVATDAGGNIFVTGFFYSPSITFGTTALTNAGNNDIFIVKFDPGGNVQWAKSAGGTTDDTGLHVAADAGSNVLVTGYFQSSLISFGTTSLTNSGSNDMFLVKMDGALDIHELEGNVMQILIFPNPFSAQTTLQASSPLKNATLTVANCFGQTVAEITSLSGQTITFSRGSLAAGLYFARLTEDHKIIATQKLVITD